MTPGPSPKKYFILFSDFFGYTNISVPMSVLRGYYCFYLNEGGSVSGNHIFVFGILLTLGASLEAEGRVLAFKKLTPLS